MLGLADQGSQVGAEVVVGEERDHAGEEGAHVGQDVAGVGARGWTAATRSKASSTTAPLRWPPAVDGLLAHAGPGRDGFDGDPGVALLAAQRQRGVEDRQAGGLAAPGDQRLGSGGHGPRIAANETIRSVLTDGRTLVTLNESSRLVSSGTGSESEGIRAVAARSLRAGLSPLVKEESGDHAASRSNGGARRAHASRPAAPGLPGVAGAGPGAAVDGPGRQEVTRVEIDERAGGAWRTWKADDGVIVGGFDSELVELVADRPLVFRWGFIGPQRRQGAVLRHLANRQLQPRPGGWHGGPAGA